ncbi:ribosomal protein S18 acetylase RimI-like enzyme [Nocardioides cavernae]|uniref:Ribosomal protein S18 acetylase RimI-like enzyme n=1 Tax=Nocardioides cavernae TaxID=1921566 RepID=A0A7Y9GZ04_9ACTN|nr:GNAT family N-acetyltransferase [Nocardioides cavernae]NYE34940.1 ribosomal protein S18 acetylase RimI-like enzyme [Nocardioides cavernae]
MADGLSLRPMTPEEYVAYRAVAEDDYAQHVGRAGDLDAHTAARRASEEYDTLLPDGLASTGQHLWTAVVAGEAVGLGWIELRDRASGTSAWVYDVRVEAEHRGRGLGRALMQSLHAAAHEMGAASVALNVFGHNTPAIALYESLGYTVTAQQMRLDL